MRGLRRHPDPPRDHPRCRSPHRQPQGARRRLFRYATVLENSYRSGQITLRPYMWRSGTHLTSGEAKPNGEMMLAREIDSLNVGVRTVDDVLWTMEHEAAHIAFDLASGNEANEEKTDQTVRACQA